VNNWKVIPTIVLTTVLIFGAGVFTGGMLVDYVKQNHPRMGIRRQSALPPPAFASTTNGFPASTKPVRPPEVLSSGFLQRLDNDLHLNKDEREAVQKVISDGQNQMRKVLQDARLEMREVLSPAHREQFDELMKRPFRKPIFNTNAAPGATNALPAATIAPTNAP